MKIGLYFGSFNPIHVGHLIIANHIAEYSDLDEVWFVVTPHNPFKKKSTLLDNFDRLELVHRATKDYDKLKPCDIEFNLPQPNYTINTLVHLQEKYPGHEFALLMGEDNLKSFHKWKNYQVILEHHHIYVYPRISGEQQTTIFDNHPKIHHIDAPVMELSSTFIRKSIKAGKNVKPMLPEHVWEHIDDMLFYK
ncbi:nicotinate (nicotinamide) nucleotide adenylyltransferase [Aestuariibaculum sp. YM273]|uniref:nicotinate (nicotinamide) nucleotide adenylyltransferase n=1 Tax=Aestuariibaculum sp. YM273 TaxID=3070659 RepID=UPI0027DB58FF|nr:nicotinate (nicotinamide) nucleotide adenylyltransferase [Aestuariibaculum sp. YM273]WMI66828.1 nicotinate (nicotinamide) nucleotide adenylyltransferase [Aestuariibaculum sp. YM273]